MRVFQSSSSLVKELSVELPFSVTKNKNLKIKWESKYDAKHASLIRLLMWFFATVNEGSPEKNCCW